MAYSLLSRHYLTGLRLRNLNEIVINSSDDGKRRLKPAATLTSNIKSLNLDVIYHNCSLRGIMCCIIQHFVEIIHFLILKSDTLGKQTGSNLPVRISYRDWFLSVMVSIVKFLRTCRKYK